MPNSQVTHMGPLRVGSLFAISRKSPRVVQVLPIHASSGRDRSPNRGKRRKKKQPGGSKSSKTEHIHTSRRFGCREPYQHFSIHVRKLVPASEESGPTRLNVRSPNHPDVRRARYVRRGARERSGQVRKAKSNTRRSKAACQPPLCCNSALAPAPQ